MICASRKMYRWKITFYRGNRQKCIPRDANRQTKKCARKKIDDLGERTFVADVTNGT